MYHSTCPATGPAGPETYHFLRSTLALYTIVFTLFLVPVPVTSILESVLITSTTVIGWSLLFLDSILLIIRNPHAYIISSVEQFESGLFLYMTDRWHTYQTLRNKSDLQTQIHPCPRNKPVVSPRLDTRWRKDILATLHKHSLHDYFNPDSFDLQKYTEIAKPIKSNRSPKTYAPTPLRIRTPRNHDVDDNFSSDEELDTSPLPARVKMATVSVKSAVGMPILASEDQGRGISTGSKETVIDDGVSHREKVTGFIAWSAMKRVSESQTGATDAGVAYVNASGLSGGGIERTDTEGSGSSWEREALGVGL